MYPDELKFRSEACMKYHKASDVLPEHLLTEIKQYIQGEYLYIPSPKSFHKKWGEKSGMYNELEDRNKEIRDKYKNGRKVIDLADEYCLSTYSIKKIIYKK